MTARSKLRVISLALVLSTATAAADSLSKPAAQWWADVTALAGDSTEGRETGSSGYMRAAEYVISRFKAEGLAPAGTQGYLQPVEFEKQLVDQPASALEVVAANGALTSLRVGEDSRIGAGGAPLPDRVDAPLVFAGYGLHLPKQGYDDFADVNLRGKVVVVSSGGPADISGPIKSNARFCANGVARQDGRGGDHHAHDSASGRNSLGTAAAARHAPGMYLADAPCAKRRTVFLARRSIRKNPKPFRGLRPHLRGTLRRRRTRQSRCRTSTCRCAFTAAHRRGARAAERRRT